MFFIIKLTKYRFCLWPSLYFSAEPKFRAGGGRKESKPNNPLPLQASCSRVVHLSAWILNESRLCASFQVQRVTPVTAAGVSSYKTDVWPPVSKRSDKVFVLSFCPSQSTMQDRVVNQPVEDYTKSLSTQKLKYCNS